MNLASLLLPHLPTDRLIQAVGNVETRDEFGWLREETLEEVDRCLVNRTAIDAFEHALAGVVMTSVLQRAYLEHREPESGWIDDFVRRHPMTAIWGAIRNEASKWKRAVVQPAIRPAPVEDLVTAILGQRTRQGSDPPRGLIVSRDADQRMERTIRQLLSRFSDDGVPLTWLRVTGRGAGLRALRASTVDNLTTVDVPADALRDVGTDPDLSLERLSRLTAEGDRFATMMSARIPELVPQWIAGRRVGRALTEQCHLAFMLFFSEKYPFARGLIAEARRAGVGTFAYFPSIELGAPSNYRYAVGHLFVPNLRTMKLLVELKFDAARVSPVGSTEVDIVLANTEVPAELPAAALRVLFLTKWPDCAIDNRPILAATRAACEASGRPWHIEVRRHPRDLQSYGRFESARVTMSKHPYEQQLRWCNLVVTGMSNSVFHALALPKATLVVNTNPRIDLGQHHLFERPDLPQSMRYTETLDGVRAEIAYLVQGELQAEAPPESLVAELFHSLDGRTAERIAATIAADALASSRGQRQGGSLRA